MPDRERTDDDAGRLAKAAAILDRATDLKEDARKSGDASKMERAIAAFDELENLLAKVIADPHLEEVRAIGRYNRAGALYSLERIVDAAQAFAAVADLYEEHANERLRDVGRLASVRRKLLISIPDPPRYLVAGEAESRLGAAAEDGDVSATVARARALLASHERARGVLLRFRGTATPFVLFLRSFEMEAYDMATGESWIPETGLEPHVVSMSTTNPSTLERQLVGVFDAPPLVVSVANRASIFESAWASPRLFLPDDGWQDIIRELVRAASSTVMQVSTITPGVQWELEQIRQYGNPHRTLIVCGADDESGVEMKNALLHFAGLSPRDETLVSPSDSVFAGFPHVVSWSDVARAGLDALQPLSELIPAIRSFAELDPGERLRLLM